MFRVILGNVGDFQLTCMRQVEGATKTHIHHNKLFVACSRFAALPGLVRTESVGEKLTFSETVRHFELWENDC